MNNNLNKLNEVFKSVFNKDLNIEITTTKNDIEEWDSIGHLNLIIELEETFNISLSKDQIENFNSVSDIIDILKNKF